MNHYLGERVRRLREELLLSQEELAKRLDWGVERVRAIEDGRVRAVPLYEITELVGAVGGSPAYLDRGIGNLGRSDLPPKLKALFQSAENFVKHCKEFILTRFERWTLWTKVMEESSHRSAISPQAWRRHHSRILGTVHQKVAPIAIKRSPSVGTRVSSAPKTGITRCLCSDPNFRFMNMDAEYCPCCGELMDR